MEAKIKEKATEHISAKMDAVYIKFNEVVDGSLEAIVDREAQMNMLDSYTDDYDMYLYIYKLIINDRKS